MILHYFINKENKDKKIANFLYLQTINASKDIINSNIFNKKKDFELSFEINSIILIVIFIGAKKKTDKDWGLITQEMLNIFIKDLDHSLRLSGISDMSIGKYVKAYTKKFYFRLKELEKVFTLKDINSFKDYLTKTQILKDNEAAHNLKFFFKHLTILLKRAQIIENKRLLFVDLFK